MPKQSVKAEFNNFIQGLITEASPLNFPPNASFDEENFELNRDGSRQRRNGLGFEGGYALIATNITESDFEAAVPLSFKWTEVDGSPGLNFVAIQVGNRIYFHNMELEPISAAGLLGFITLANFPTNVRYSMTSIDGRLVVVAGVDKICIIEYNSTTEVFSETYESLQVRDVWGIEVSE